MNLPDSRSASISQTIEKLRQLTQVDVQANWRYYPEDLPISAIDPSNWQLAQLNDKKYIAWSAGRQVRWLAQRLTIPHNLQGYPLAGLALRLVLTWWAEDAQIFVNGQLVQEGDLFDSSARVLLTPSATPGEEIIVAVRLVSPGHDIGALMHSKCVYERERGRGERWGDGGDGEMGEMGEVAYAAATREGRWGDGENFSIHNPAAIAGTQSKSKIQNPIDPGFVADELTVLHNYLEAFEPEKLDFLAAAITKIDWNSRSDAAKFDTCLSAVRQNLQPLAVGIKQRCLHLLGHAHLDMAWLWSVSETWDVAQSTFESVLTLQQDFPDLTFCHTSPALYAWIEEHRPDLFTAIQEAVAAGRWEVVGGMWVEPEVNLVTGESLVRQLLYGQRYTQEKFGAIAKVAWLPDSFGFCWQLPQIFKQSGIEYFVTGKLHWNDTTKFPHGVFWWQSPDGTQLLTLMSPPNLRGVMDTNPIAMASYAIDWETQTGLKDAFWLPGVGDHGGGPSRDMLEVQQRSSKSPFFPRLKFTKAIDYLSLVSSQQSTVNSQQSTINSQQSTINN